MEERARVAEENKAKIAKEKADLEKQLQSERDAASLAQQEASKLSSIKNNLDKQVKELTNKLNEILIALKHT